MDRSVRRPTRDHHQRRSHPLTAPGTLRSGQQQQLTSGGNYSSTDSDNEGAAVYESLTPIRVRHVLPQSHSATGPFAGDMMARLYGQNTHGTGPRIGENNSSHDTKGVRTTNLDDDEQSPLASRKDFSNAAAAKIYQLLNFSPETASPETDDFHSETSNEHNVSDCPTIPVHGSSHGGSYMNPSTASDISCSAISPHPLYQYGVQQLSVQHLHNPYLTSSLASSSHLHHHHHHQTHRPSNSIYFSNRDSHLLDDPQDKHASASSPTTTGSSDRCLLPTSSSGNICKLSNNNSVIIASSDRHLFNASMQSSHGHAGADRVRPLSEHYHASSILRTPQCPLHAGPVGLSTYPNRTNLRPANSTTKPPQKSRGLKRALTWRNLTIVLSILCLALVAALGYFAVAIGNHRQDDAGRCSRAQEVISHSQFDNGPVLRVRRNAELLNGSQDSTLNWNSNFTEQQTENSSQFLNSSQFSDSSQFSNSSQPFSFSQLDNALNWADNETLFNRSQVDPNDEIFWEFHLNVSDEGDSKSNETRSNETKSTESKSNEGKNDELKNNETTGAKNVFPVLDSVANLQLNKSIAESSGLSQETSKKNISLGDFVQNDAPVARGTRAFATKDQTFTILQTVLLSHYTDENGLSQPKLVLQTPKVFTRDNLRVVSRSGRDVTDNESWDGEEKGFSNSIKDSFSDEDQLFMELTPGVTTELAVSPRAFWLGRITQKKAANMVLNLTISPTATLVFYGRKNLPPTHAEYNFMHTMRRERTVRDTTDLDVRVFNERLDAGDWYFGLYNDKGKEESASLTVTEPGNSYCANDCNGQGSCIDGLCQCLAGFGGDDCSQTVCPLLCNGHGKYSQGGCQCFPGWKGSACDIPEFQCDDPNCSGRGKCWSGKCVCDLGFSGSRCETVQCPKECTQHGICINGTCFCQPGWIGVVCDLPVNDSRRLCSNHGSLNPITQKCNCDAKWTGDSCSTEICSPACGPNGRCENGRCACDSGWTGLTCESPQCPACGPHGKCNNGTCVCEKGWSGRLCTTENCPNECNRHGTCVQDGHSWKCQCEALWKGDSCAMQMERCDDGRDNDGDGLVDCADNDCCSADVCLSHINCLASPEPQEVLLREQAPPDTASFFDRVKFLIRENGVQSYVDRSAFDPKRVSVLRGRVVDSGGVGLTGVRMSIQAPPGETSPWGFTTTRRDGMFDLIFNGGGSHIVNYQKNNYRDTSVSVTLGWNEFGVVDTVKMFRETELAAQNRVGFIVPSTGDDNLVCELSNIRFQPQIFPFWKNFPSGGETNGPKIYFDAQVLQESFNISGSDIRLNHLSSRASGFASSLLIVLTKETIAVGLNKITVRITNAGMQEETIYDALPNLSHVYSWNGTNAYKQVVYGFTSAKVSIGYEGKNCKDIFWVHQVVKIKGRDVPVSDVGSWDLSVHHRYNTEAGILHRGDGANVYFSEGVLDVRSVVGTGQIRPVICKENCAVTSATNADLLAPVALAAAPDGSLYIGDFNLIRRVKPDGSMVTIIQLPSPALLQKYFIAVNPANGQLYISLSQMLKVVRVSSLNNPADVTNNFVTAVGNGMQCVPRAGVFSCGENVAATAASMIFPKGIAFDKTGSLYIADGGAIRFVDQAGIIKTLVPQTSYSTTWVPMACGDILEVSKLSLRWPSALAVSPVDDSLYISDANLLIKLIRSRKMAEIVAGNSLICDTTSGNDLDGPIGVAVSLSGTVYVTEGNADSWKIRKISGDSAEIMLSSCTCTNGTGCDCTPIRKGAEEMQMPSALAVITDDALFVADLKALKIFSVAPAIPQPNSKMEFEVEAPEKGEIYTFNRYGLHMETKDIFTSQRLFKFTYNVDTISGKIRSVTDKNGKTCTIQRDYRGQVGSLECGNGWKTTVTNTQRGFIKDVKFGDGFEINFAYDSDSGLIVGRTDSSAKPFVFKYDQFGRLKEVVQSGGNRLQWSEDFSAKILKKSNFFRNENRGKISFFRPSFAFLLLNFPSPNFFLRMAGNNGSISAQLTFAKETNSTKFRQFLKINETILFSFEFDSILKEETVFDRENSPIFSTKFDAAGRVASLMPVVGDFLETKFSYDKVGRLIKWEQGSMWKTMLYNEIGLPVLQKSANGANWTFEYNQKKKLSKVTKGMGEQILLDYDASGGVRAIKTPKGNTLMVNEEPLLSFRRISIRDSQSEIGFSQDFNDNGHLIASSYPSGLRRTVLTYTSENQLQAVYFGRNSIFFSYNDNGRVDQVKKISDELTTTADISYFGDLLVDSVSLKYSGIVELEPITTRYEYDTGLNLVRRKLQVGNSDVSVTDFTTNHRTRQISRFGPFSVSQSQIGALIVSDENAIFMKQLNNLGKTRTHVLRLQQRIVASTEMLFNEIGQLAELKIRKGESEPQISFSFKYDLNSQLIEATRNKQAYWAYSYDANGNLVTSNGSGNRFTNSSFGFRDESTDANVLVDQDGFVVKKDEFQFEFDSRGQVTRAWNTGSGTDVKFHYDDQRRLIASQNSPSEIIQFIYADLGRSDTVTHIYQKKTRTLTQLFYDVTGQLIAMARDGNPYYILQSKLSSTIFDQSGKIVKEIFFSPFGEVEADSNPDFFYPFDQTKNLRDGLAKIVFHGGRPYHPESGRYLSPRFSDLRKFNLKDLNPYVYQENDPLMANQEKEANIDVKQWVKVLGIQSSITVAHGIPVADLLDLDCDSASSLPIVNNSCIFLPILKNFESLSTQTARQVSMPDVMSSPMRISSNVPFFGRGTILTSNNGIVDTATSGTGARTINDAIDFIISGSQMIPWRMSTGTKEKFFLVKKGNIPALDLDISRLRTALPAVNFTTKREAGDTSLAIQGGGVILNISYVPQTSDGVRWFRDFFTEDAVQRAWSLEKSRVSAGLPVTTAWTDNEKSLLKTQGVVPGYGGHLLRDISNVPSLASDPANVVFVHG